MSDEKEQKPVLSLVSPAAIDLAAAREEKQDKEKEDQDRWRAILLKVLDDHKDLVALTQGGDRITGIAILVATKDGSMSTYSAGQGEPALATLVAACHYASAQIIERLRGTAAPLAFPRPPEPPKDPEGDKP